MAGKFMLDTLPFSTAKEITTLVENRRAYTLNNFELNVFETYQESHLVPLRFQDLVLINMIQGKKIMHLEGRSEFEYLPGETLILPAYQRMKIDFPEANMEIPTQCTALTISKSKLDTVLDYLNEFYPLTHRKNGWIFQQDYFRFDNESEITVLINKLFQLSISSDKYKEALADLTLKELLIRMLQMQNLLASKDTTDTNDCLFSHLKDYIARHLSSHLTVDALCKTANMSRTSLFREFKQQYGISPMEFVIRERIAHSKQLLHQGMSVKESCYAAGFNDVNYFVRIFKKREGTTPGKYVPKT